MAKVQQKSEKITAFGGIFFVLDKFDSILSSVIDSHLGLRSRLIAYLENRDGNANVHFMQAETHRRFFEMMRSFGIHVRSFRADCGSYSEDIVKMVMEHTDKFYIRAERHAGLYEKVKRLTGWTTVEIGFQQYDVQSFPFESFEDVKHCRLVVQRQRKQKGEQLDLFDGKKKTYQEKIPISSFSVATHEDAPAGTGD